MGNKKVLIAVVLVLLLGAGFFLLKNPGSNSLTSSTAQNANKLTFSSIQDAMNRSLSLECTFTDDQGRETKSYMKAGAVRTNFTGASPSESGSAIIKDKKMYFWTNETKEGFMMEVPEVTPGQSMDQPSGTSQTQASDVLETMEKYKNSCKSATVADSLFTPPTDVKFTDYSQMMQDVQKMQQPSRSDYDEKQMQEMMQKYSDQ